MPRSSIDARHRGLQDVDAADLTQDVLRAVAGSIGRLNYDPRRGSFGGWLFAIARHRLHDALARLRQGRGTGETTVHDVKTVRRWEIASGRQLARMAGHAHNVLDLAYTPDGRRALSCGDDGLVWLWDLESGRGQVLHAAWRTSVQGLALTPDGLPREVFIDDQGQSRSVPAHPDSNPLIAAVRNAVDGRYVAASVIAGAGGIRLRNVRAVADPSLGVPLPPGVAFSDFPYGFINSELHGITAGGSATVRIDLPRPGPFVNTFYKFGPETDDPLTPGDERIPHWYEFLFDGTTGAESLGDVLILHLVDGGRGDADLTANGVIVDPGGPAIYTGPPRVQRVVIQDGSPQRSKISQLTVLFSDVVTLDPGAIRLVRRVGHRSIPVRRLGLITSVVDGRTAATLNVPRRRFPGGSLPDGRYQLIVRADRVRDRAGRALDGDADAQPGSPYTLAFRRRLGDADGDGDVDRRDRKLRRRP